MDFIIEPFYSLAKAAHYAGCTIDDILEKWGKDIVNLDIYIDAFSIACSGVIAFVTFTDKDSDVGDFVPDENYEIIYNVADSSLFKVSTPIFKPIYCNYKTFTIYAELRGLWRIKHNIFNRLSSMSRDEYKTVIITAHETSTGEMQATAELEEIFSNVKMQLIEENNLRISHYELMKLIQQSDTRKTPKETDIENTAPQKNKNHEERHARTREHQLACILNAVFEILEDKHKKAGEDYPIEMNERVETLLNAEWLYNYINIHNAKYSIKENANVLSTRVRDIIRDVKHPPSEWEVIGGTKSKK
ncbi:hypothetical protein LZ92_19225 [Salmonella enterica]|nr:hypothetical protein [Salmonella enterica subsp. enterica serovar Newport]EBP1502398.1 hypothetical protein [Salmonella enterica]